MDPWHGVAILAAGSAAGAINAAVGSGTLISFPTLIALGYPPVVANISNNLGLVPGSVAGAWSYRQEIAAVGRRRIAPLSACSATGGAVGALALLTLPSSAFDAIVPVLILLAVVLVVLQPRLARRVAPAHVPGEGDVVRPVGAGLLVATLLAGVYGGYFGAAQGVLLIGLLGWLLTSSLQQANGVKNWLSAIVNGLAALTFVLAAPERIDWTVVALIATGSGLGGLVGGRLGRRLPPWLLRAVIVIVGVVGEVKLVAG